MLRQKPPTKGLSDIKKKVVLLWFECQMFPTGCVFEYLVPRCLCCLGKLWNLRDCGLASRSGPLEESIKGHISFWLWPEHSFFWSAKMWMSHTANSFYSSPYHDGLSPLRLSQTKSSCECFSQVSWCHSNVESCRKKQWTNASKPGVLQRSPNLKK